MELLKVFCGALLVVWNFSDSRAQTIVETQQNSIPKNGAKPRTLYDYQTRVVAFKDLIDSKCLLEILTNDESIISQRLANYGSSLKLLPTTSQLSKREIWRLAGTRISDFCRGFPTYLIQIPQPDSQNDLPLVRRKRDERHYFVGKIRGQTQSQYLNFGFNGAQPGKAEAESSHEGTKAVVTGTNGIGQAQSQSSPIDCSQCFGPGYQDQALLFGYGRGPAKLTGPGYPAGSIRPGHRYPGEAPGDGNYPGRTGGTQGGNFGRPGESGGYPGHLGEEGYPRPGAQPSSQVAGGPRRAGEGGTYPTGPGDGNYPGPGGQQPSELTGGGKQPGEDINTWSPSRTYPTGPRRPGDEGTLGPGGQSATPSGSGSQPGEHIGSNWDQNRPGGPNYSGLQQSSSSQKPWGSEPSGVVGPNYRKPGGQPGEGGGNSWEGGSGGQARQSGKFYGTFEGTYETDVTGEGGYSRKGQGTAGGTTSGVQGPPGGTTYPERATQQGGIGTSGSQYINGQWVPSGAGGTQWELSTGGPRTAQWADGRRVPSSTTGGTSGRGQWVDGRWVPSGGTLVPAVQDQWAPAGGSPGQWSTGGGVDGQLVDGKWTPAGGGAGGGQWVPPRAGGANGSPGGNGQWVDGRWAPAAGAGGRGSHTGPWGPASGTEGDKWVSPGSAGTGTSPGAGQWVPSTGPLGGQGAGQWAPPGAVGPEGTNVGQGAGPGTGQWINGQFLQVPAGGSGPTGGPSGVSGPGQWIPGVPGSSLISPYSPGYQYGPGLVGQDQGGRSGVGSQDSGSGGVGGQGGGLGGVIGQGSGPGVGSQGSGSGGVGSQGGGPGGVGGQGGGSGGVGGQGGGPGGVTGQGGRHGVAGQAGGPGIESQGSGPGGVGGQGIGPGVGGQSGGPPGVGQSGGPIGVSSQPRPGGEAGGQGPGQWINGQWVPAGGLGPGAAVQGGPSGAPGQWSSGGSGVPNSPGYQPGIGGQGEGQWVPSRPAPGGLSGPFSGNQWTTGGSTPSYGPVYQPAPGGYPSGYGSYPGGGYYPGSQAGAPGGQAGAPGGQAGAPGGQAGVPGGQAGAPGGGYVPGGQVPPGQYVQGGGAGQSGQWNYGSSAGGQWINGTWVPTGADDSDSQVLTSVQQSGNESIIAKAQAQGKYQGATAQSQVSGAYSGTGSFSASAGSDDGKRGALTQVSGGKDGAQSSAQGRGGVGQSQAQVTLDAGTGDALSSAQTSAGNQQGTQTQVRASEKGGLADAQANGAGPTSSQAQIGFTPYDDNEAIDNQTSPFNGGGTAAAQSGTNTGMTQTQIQGKFRYGIRYQGAAQAGSGSTAIRNLTEPTGYFKPLNFTANKVNFTGQSQSQQAAVAAPAKRADPLPEARNSAETTTERIIQDRNKLFEMQVHKVDPKSQEDPVVVSSLNETETSEDPEYVDEDYGEDEDISEEAPEPIVASGKLLQRNLEPPLAVNTEEPQKKVVSQSSDYQKQHILLDPLEDLDATVHQSKGNAPVDGMVLQPGQIIPGSTGYKIPAGFRGRVTSISNGPNTYAIGQHAQAQSVTLSPGSGKIYYSKPSSPIYGVVTKTTYKDGHYGTGYSYQPIYHPVGYRVKSGTILPNFVSISKSETGSENLGTGRRTPNVYYTQSSSCGMFTNSCVYTNGKKTCFPVRKMNSDGSPVTC
ncbi:collagen alpha-2(I) chain isoform X2 [Euwallacea similis]|uniref:collagen alpha-2(I) chain isoform X2 n=1 Tax=Euwallacea similis TaxID=1736056 RepID=UPI003450458F